MILDYFKHTIFMNYLFNKILIFRTNIMIDYFMEFILKIITVLVAIILITVKDYLKVNVFEICRHFI